MAWKEKPIVSIGNVWCGCCGEKEFEILHSACLKCTNCESEMYFRVTWGQMETNGWYVAHALSFYRGDSSNSHERCDGDNPKGIKWRRTDGEGLYDIAVIRFNCNNGKHLGNPKVLEEMKNKIRGLEKDLDQTRSDAGAEERICKELASPSVGQ